ncbi:MAG: aminotransferase class I/II-fold pyridoxal phosphate-dependent enzyme [Deltaproteobacteria bacterium]|nr:aminotransferase class I/II-fold pyridoxal phosphate-dependent enzyme [Deltaproteobacteria bacterium]NIS78273.1 aminotransferase class I/II-fold pyridoxal phosphate-dependent enzyme [Deltaproteobacteria bacterium]
MIKFLDLRKQYEAIKGEISGAITDVIRDSAFVGGKYVNKFEEEFAQYHQVKHCIGVGNGTDALEILIESLNIPKGSEIIVPANTFIATAEAVTRAGHKVVFCDCNPDNHTISIEDVKKRITGNTRAIIAVHLYGHPCDMEPLLMIAETNQLIVIEDCAQSHGAEYKGKKVSTFGIGGIFSFYPGKNLGAYGDGGAIATNDDDIALKCRMISNHGRLDKFAHQFEGRNSRLDGLQAAILSVKLKHLDKWIETRREIAKRYVNELSAIGDVKLPIEETWAKHVYHLFVIITQKRNMLRKYLEEKGVQTGIHYPESLPKLPAYRYCGQSHEEMWANRLDSQLMSLPIGDHLEPDDIKFITSEVAFFYEHTLDNKNQISQDGETQN